MWKNDEPHNIDISVYIQKFVFQIWKLSSCTLMNKHILYLLDMTWTEFETEGVTESGNDHDYLMITTSSQSSIKLQGSALYIQNRFLCEENVSLQFVSDGINNNKGFLIRYSGAPLFYSTVNIETNTRGLYSWFSWTVKTRTRHLENNNTRL